MSRLKGQTLLTMPHLPTIGNNATTRYGKTYWSKGSKHYQVAANQNWQCPICGESLFNGEAVNTHHIVQVSELGTDQAENLVHLHSCCQHRLHSNQKRSQ